MPTTSGISPRAVFVVSELDMPLQGFKLFKSNPMSVGKPVGHGYPFIL